jgi:hypothetical protein
MVITQLQLKHSCWNCLHLNCDKIELKSCNEGHKLKSIFEINKCNDFKGDV